MLGSATSTRQPAADSTACRRESAVAGSSWATTTKGEIDGTGSRATGILPVPGLVGSAEPVAMPPRVRRREQWPGGGPGGRRSSQNVHNSAGTRGVGTDEFHELPT